MRFSDGFCRFQYLNRVLVGFCMVFVGFVVGASRVLLSFNGFLYSFCRFWGFQSCLVLILDGF